MLPASHLNALYKYDMLYEKFIICYIENDDNSILFPLQDGKLKSEFNRTTNVSGVYKQRGGTCYAYAPCSAYINTIKRIYGSRAAPTFEECLKIAAYNGENGGEPEESLKRLENHFHYGILYKKTKKISIRDVMMLSVIVSFSTSLSGWKHVQNGELLYYPGGISDGWHSTLIEQYDFVNYCFVCQNSWGADTAEPRFKFSQYATHDYEFCIVYFTLQSIRRFSYTPLNEHIKKCKKNLKGKELDAAIMDKTTATYTTDYICEKLPDNEIQRIKDSDDSEEFEGSYIGYDVDQWIKIQMNRPREYPKYYYINKID